MGRIISFGWMQMRMSIRDGEFSYCAYFMILRIVQMAVLVLHTDSVSSIERTQTHRLFLFYLWPGNGSSAMSG